MGSGRGTRGGPGTVGFGSPQRARQCGVLRVGSPWAQEGIGDAGCRCGAAHSPGQLEGSDPGVTAGPGKDVGSAFLSGPEFTPRSSSMRGQTLSRHLQGLGNGWDA